MFCYAFMQSRLNTRFKKKTCNQNLVLNANTNCNLTLHAMLKFKAVANEFLNIYYDNKIVLIYNYRKLNLYIL